MRMASFGNISRGHRTFALLIPASVLLVALFVVPLLEVLRTSIFDPEPTAAHFKRFFELPVYPVVFYRTAYVSLVVTLLCILIGYPAAYFLSSCKPKTRAYLILLILLPFWMSLLIRTYSWIAILGKNGVINAMLINIGVVAEPLPMLYTTGAVYLAMVQILLPVMILTCYGVMINIDRGLIDAARVLGASQWRAFAKVFLPLSMAGPTTGSIIIFILSMGFFVTPALVGGRQDLMAGNLIDFQVTQMVNWGFASALGVLLLLLTVVIVAALHAIAKMRIVSGRAWP